MCIEVDSLWTDVGDQFRRVGVTCPTERERYKRRDSNGDLSLAVLKRSLMSLMCLR